LLTARFEFDTTKLLNIQFLSKRYAVPGVSKNLGAFDKSITVYQLAWRNSPKTFNLSVD